MVMMTGEYNNILVSNDVDSNKLYLKIKVKAKRVVVAANYNVRECIRLQHYTIICIYYYRKNHILI